MVEGDDITQVNFSTFFSKIASEVKQSLGREDLYDLLNLQFTTSGCAEKIVRNLTCLWGLKNYFE